MKIKDEIDELLASDLSAYKIGRESGVSQPIITSLRTGRRTVNRLTVASAQKLIDYWHKQKH